MKATYGARRTEIANCQRQQIAFGFFEDIRQMFSGHVCHEESFVYSNFLKNKTLQLPTRPIFMLNTIGNNVEIIVSYLI